MFLLFIFSENLLAQDISYEQYLKVEEKLNNFQNLDHVKEFSCVSTTESFWKDWSMSLVMLKDLEFKNDSVGARLAEENMLRNLFIKIAFSRLYLSYIKKVLISNISSFLG